MIIQKEYRFYAAHRNETLLDKCSNLHGHRYGLRCFFEVERDGDISTLFGTFDEKVEPWLKEFYDHGMLINIMDPLYETLKHRFGFDQFRPGQEEVVRAALAGQDLLAIMPTGGGKSLCFQLPALLYHKSTG